ncbi:alpha-ketoacid dehydrogenase subunit beta [Kordiimonas pumila]|uniref:Alpha-ketoacid dehydrogenase subunit beta n=1 Tax=Kordiimonas pumila TaxID=2161677 RepID=A0ABV7D4W5_9PROT|nr:transketolase C-terminal domain-containing protein [Kordiimonas pumila]
MTEMTIRQALNAAHHQLMAEDDRVIVIGEDVGVGVFGVTSGLVEAFGENRVLNTPISETAFLGMALGASMTGLKPIVEIMFCDFMGVCFDQLMNQISKMRFLSGGRVEIPLVIRTTMGAGDGSGAMHSQSLHGLFAQLPGLVVLCPSTPADAAGMLKTAIKGPEPVIMLEHKGLYDMTGAVSENLVEVPLAEAVCRRQGDSITLVAVSAMVHECLKAAKALEGYGIQAEVIDARSVMPVDYGTVCRSVCKTGHLLVVDEGAAFGGFADSVIAGVVAQCFAVLKAAPVKLVPLHTPVPYAQKLEQAWLPGQADIVKAALKLMGNGK